MHPLQKIFTKKSVLLFFTLIFIYISAGIIGNIVEYRKYQSELLEYRENIDQLSQDSLQLNDLLTFLNTDEAVDAYARTRLGFQQSGERAFIITEDGFTSATRVGDLEEPEEANASKWLRYFFY